MEKKISIAAIYIIHNLKYYVPMRYALVFMVIILAMVATSFWEAYSEGRNAWHNSKVGWKLKLGKYVLTGYHFFLFFVMFPALLSLPFIASGWDKKMFLVVASAYLLGIIVEDFFWYVVNPSVGFKEWFTDFSDYYPWIKFKGKKIFPVYYIYAIALLLAVLFVFK